jgi:hypothetical protein
MPTTRPLHPPCHKTQTCQCRETICPGGAALWPAMGPFC